MYLIILCESQYVISFSGLCATVQKIVGFLFLSRRACLRLWAQMCIKELHFKGWRMQSRGISWYRTQSCPLISAQLGVAWRGVRGLNAARPNYRQLDWTLADNQGEFWNKRGELWGLLWWMCCVSWCLTVVCLCLFVCGQQVSQWINEVGESRLKTLGELEDSLDQLRKKQALFRDFYAAAYVRVVPSFILTVKSISTNSSLLFLLKRDSSVGFPDFLVCSTHC